MKQNTRNNTLRYPTQHRHPYLARPSHGGNLNPNATHFQPQPQRFHQQPQQRNKMWNERFDPPPPHSPHIHSPMGYPQVPPTFNVQHFPMPQQNMGIPPPEPHHMAPPIPPAFGHFQNMAPIPPHHIPPPPLGRPPSGSTPPFPAPPLDSPNFSLNSPFSCQPQAIVNSNSVEEPPVDPKKMYKETMINVIQKWLKVKHLTIDVDINKNADSLMKIHEYKSMLKDLLCKIEALRSMNDQLAENMEMSSQKWDELIEQIETLKIEISSMQEKVLEPKQVEYVENLLKQRKKKRERQQRKKVERKEENLKELSKRMKLHQMIDEWQHNEISNIQRQKMLESLKNEAGESLTEVKRKQSETQELLQLLQHVQELREIRKETAIYKGILVTKQDDEAFTMKIENATKLLNEQNKIYEDEERALRVLREEEAEDFERNEVEKRKKRKQKHEKALSKVDPMQVFRSHWCQGEQSISGLIHIRSLWDSYLCAPLTPGCSRLPDEFPEPSEPSNELWNRFLLRSDKSKKATNLTVL